MVRLPTRKKLLDLNARAQNDDGALRRRLCTEMGADARPRGAAPEQG